MNLSDIAAAPLRWQPVRQPLIKLLLAEEKAQAGLALDPFFEDFRDDPYPLLREVQQRDPVHRLETARAWPRYDR